MKDNLIAGLDEAGRELGSELAQRPRFRPDGYLWSNV